MAQPVKNKKIVASNVKKVKPKKYTAKDVIKKNIERSKKPHPQYGTSKLEERFAKDFLDKLGVEYIRQFEAKDIKRFYDFAIRTPLGSMVLIEIDGDYYHSYGKLYEEMSPMQKHNHRVDEIKNEWAHMHGIPIIRIWEHDINKNPEKVRKALKEALGLLNKQDDKKKRH